MGEIKKLGKLIISFFVILIVIFAIIQGIARSFSPSIDHYRPRIEAWASDLLHQPVQTSHVHATWTGIHPVISFDDLVIYNKAKTAALIHIKQFQINIAVLKSLIHWRIEPGMFKLSGTHLVIHQLGDGLYDVNGIQGHFAKARSELNADSIQNMLEWLANQGQITLENVSVDWYGQNNLMIPITDLQLKLSKRFIKRQLLGVASIGGDALQTQLRFVMNLQGEIFDPNQLKMKLFVQAKRVNLQRWLASHTWHGIELTQGQLDDIKLWINWQDKQLQNAQTVLSMHDVKLYSQAAKKMTALNQMQANLYWENRMPGWDLTADMTKLNINHHELPDTKMSFSLFPAVDDKPVQQIFAINYINLRDLSALLQDNDLMPNEVRQYWQKLQPSGIFENVTATHTGPFNENDQQYSVTSDFQKLSWKHWEKIPGVSNLQGKFNFAPELAQITINSQKVILDFGNLFRKPLNLNVLDADLYWQKTQNFWRLRAKNLATSDDHLGVQGEMDLFKFNDVSSPIVNLLLGFREEDVSKVNNYIPVGISHPKLIKWLEQAFKRGDSVDGTLLLQGALSDFPFDNNTGTFQVLMRPNNVDFNYMPGWPTLTNATADVLFYGRSMDVNLIQGKILGAPVHQAHASITNLSNAILQLQTQLKTTLANGLKFVNESPLKKTFGAGTKYITMQGLMQLYLQLQIPFKPEAKASVQGRIDIAPNSSVSMPKTGFELNRLQGQVFFTENSASSQNLKANFLDQPVNLNIETKHPAKNVAATYFQMQGLMSIDLLRQRFNNKYWKYFSGASPYQLSLEVISQQKGQQQALLKFDSDLTGIGVDLPEPFKKTAASKKPLHAELSLGNANIQKLTFKYDHLNGNLNFQEISQKWNLQAANFNLENLNLMGMDITQANVVVIPKDNAWSVQINSPSLAGELLIPKDYQHSVIEANFQRIRISPIKTQTNKRINPNDVPSFNLLCHDFVYGDKHFGEISLAATRENNGLSIDKLKAALPGMTLTARGFWHTVGGGQQTTLNGSITSQNLGNALRNWGMTNSLAGGSGGSEFTLSWPDAFYAPKLSALNGNLSFEFRNGRILNVGQGAEMGIGRVLSLFSLQTLPRRLSLDFSDLTQSGFSFDIMSGDFTFRDGNAYTEKFYINGPIAKVQAKGRIGLASKDYDLNMTVTPYVTSSIPVIATIAGGPIVGVAAWVANKVLSGPVNKISSHNYHVTGSWENPAVE